MKQEALEEFITYWEAEGARYARAGDYAWMAEQLPGRRVLEIGCGVGFGTVALAGRGLEVLALDRLDACLAAARARTAGQAAVRFLQADLEDLGAGARAEIAAFEPDTVVCWLMGAPSEVEYPDRESAAQAVAALRERMHRHVAELAASLPEVRYVHLVDRTAIPWQAKDIGRDVLVRYHLRSTFADLPFTAERRDALYRKLADDAGAEPFAKLRHTDPRLKSVVPTLASLVARRQAAA
jgi:SAM-dependent methyltransferase